jgi:hypothetical protein
MSEGLRTKSIYETHAGQQIEVFEQSYDQTWDCKNCFRLVGLHFSFGRTMRCVKGCKQSRYMKPMLVNRSKCLNRVATKMGLQKVFPSFWPPLPSSVKAEKFGNRFAIRFSGEVFAPQHVTVRTDCQDIVCVNVTYEI